MDKIVQKKILILPDPDPDPMLQKTEVLFYLLELAIFLLV